MKNKLLLVFFFLLQFLFAQKLSHSVRALSTVAAQKTFIHAFPDTLNLLAIMVQFQSDNDSRTSGNGQFDLAATDERIIDAPPHDSAFFADHFIFARNYYSQSSNGKQIIKTTLLGKVITLKKQMKEYAPVSGNLPLAQMIEESWQAADSFYPSFPFQQYDLFTVFHAGVGKDIDLRAALGYEPTPYDIPSLYFNLSSFQSLFGNSYQGVVLKNSSFKIPNCAVLPETEVRRIPSAGGEFVLKLGINGLLVASIGSHLGLPDLFDTKTGKSAIGRFGLMDGQSIFSYSGIAPPEPSAWEKIYLGWTTPIEIFGNHTLPVPAVGLTSVGNDTIYKIPISAKEYFLVENRNRDTKNDGQTLTMKWKGATFTKTFLKDEEFFSNTNIDSAYGVILNFDELDWSLPGLLNANNNYQGGILIWHIDETVIEKSIASNSINADPLRRGVDLEEADGSQDIGQTYDFGAPASGSEDGSPIDYWFTGNIYPQYTNEFSETTNPNSLSNSFARSHVTLKNFSAQSPRMSFDAAVGSIDIQLVNVLKRKNIKTDNNDAPFAADLNGDGKQELIYTSGDSIYAFKDDLTPYFNNTTGLFFPSGGRFQPAPLWIISSSENSLVGVQDSTIYILSAKDNNSDGIADTIRVFKSNAAITTPPSTSTDNSGQSQVSVGDVRGRRIKFSNVTSSVWTKDSAAFFQSAVIGQSITAIYSADSMVISNGKKGFGGRKIKGFTSNGPNSHFIIFDDNSFGTLTSGNYSEPIVTHTIPGQITGSFAVYDVNNDGSLDLVIGAGDKLYAYNSNGVLIENFPFKTMDGGSITGSPVIARQKNGSDIVMVFGSSNGHLYAIDSKAKLLNGFPIQTGGIVSSPLFWNNYLTVSSSDTSVYTWMLPNFADTSKIYWKGFLADVMHSNYMNSTLTPNVKSSDILPKKFAYNWPNPVYSGSTNIRYFLGKAATVKIKIVNLAGELVEELRGTNDVGLDNEVPWNITNIQSGIYFAQITATGGGEEVSVIVKIAVVK